MATPRQLRILVSGSVDGKIDKLFKKVSSVQSKSGKFDALLCAGSFFGQDGSVDASWESYLSGKLQVPIETYILGPTSEAQVAKYAKVKRGGDLCDNLTYLGQQGVLVMPNGLKVAYLSGAYVESTHMLEDQPEPRVGYTKADVDGLVNFANRSSFSGVDVFLTTSWPRGVCNGAPVHATGTPGSNSLCPGSGAAASALRPRYHFSSNSSDYYERAPYSNTVQGQPPVNVSRFFGLAPVANAKKQKWIYAVNVSPMSKLSPAELTQAVPGTTPSPYRVNNHQSKPKEEEGFFFAAQKQRQNNNRGRGGGRNNNNNNNNNNNYSSTDSGPMAPPVLPPGILPPSALGPPGLLPPPGLNDNRKRKRENDGPRKPAGPCWFCLGGPEVEKHLVTNIGSKVYVALAKGGLVAEHSLILPVQHMPASAELEQPVLDEIDGFLKQHIKLFEQQGKVCVAWERNLRSQHLQLQVCPIPKELADAVEPAFREAGLALSPTFVWEKLAAGDPLPEGTMNNTKYFLVTLPDGSRLFHKCSPGFNLQFGRQVLSSPQLLNMASRVDWQVCKLNKDEETAQARKMRDLFKGLK